MLNREPPRLYFRIREPGAAVFRVAAQGRLDLELIAVANTRTGEIKPSGTGPDDSEKAEIGAWIAARNADRNQRDLRKLQALAETLNQSAHWLQTRADAAVLAVQAEPLLLALHDLRSVIARRLSGADDKSHAED